MAAVFTNRLRLGMRLESDPTIVYGVTKGRPLGRGILLSELRNPTPWNTYAREGLPVTPICSPGAPAVVAAQDPAPGDWLYFVTIDLQGTTVFTRDYQQHLASIELAKRNGVLDSAR